MENYAAGDVEVQVKMEVCHPQTDLSEDPKTRQHAFLDEASVFHAVG